MRRARRLARAHERRATLVARSRSGRRTDRRCDRRSGNSPDDRLKNTRCDARPRRQKMSSSQKLTRFRAIVSVVNTVVRRLCTSRSTMQSARSVLNHAPTARTTAARSSRALSMMRYSSNTPSSSANGFTAGVVISTIATLGMRAAKAEQHRHGEQQAAAAQHLHPDDFLADRQLVIAAEQRTEQHRRRPQHGDAQAADVVVDCALRPDVAYSTGRATGAGGIEVRSRSLERSCDRVA